MHLLYRGLGDVSGLAVVSQDLGGRGAPVLQARVLVSPQTFLTAHLFSPLQAVVQMEGDNKLVTTFKGIKSVTELNGDVITNVSWHSELVAPHA